MKLKSLAALVLIGAGAFAFAQNPDDVYKDLQKGSWIHPTFNGKVNLNEIKSAADQVKPYELRLLSVPKLGSKWVKNGVEQRLPFAKYVADQKLPFGDKSIVIVLTQKGISAYNKKLTASELAGLNNAASKLASPNDFTASIVSLAKSVRDTANTKATTGTAVRPNSSGGVVEQKSSGSSLLLGGFLCLAIPIGLVLLVIAITKKNAIKRSKNAADERRRKAIDAISYLDSYDGLILTGGQDAEALTQYRARMGETFDTGLTRFNAAKTAADYDQANIAFEQVLQDFESSKNHVNALTGGTGIAYTIPPIIDTEKAPLFEPVKGVSYFSSQPSDQLVPIEVNFGGMRKTVMVTPAERDEMMAGRMPQLRGQYDDRGSFQPWYSVRGYDPYRDYGSNNFLWQVVGISALSNMFMPHYGYGWGGGLFGGGYGGYGGHYGGGTTINNYYGDNSDFGNQGSSGDFDFNSGNSSSGDFDFGSSNDSGGFDFGGGDSGGGDFGGGGDSGGGGGDF